MTRRIALRLQYLGQDFCGWQRQPNRIAVQQVLEETIQQITGQSAVIHGAGRTDAGVHASGQVAHFDTDSPIPPDRWANILNAHLPSGIAVLESAEVGNHWHAQFSAIWRRYRYVIHTHPVPSAFLRPFSWHYYYADLCAELMHEALQPMLGEHDFRAFQRSGSKRRHACLTVHLAKCWREGSLIFVELQASGFLYGMIRLLMGQLVRVGSGELQIHQFTHIWQTGARSLVKYAAPPQGLCLIGVGYPDSPFQQAITEPFPPLGAGKI